MLRRLQPMPRLFAKWSVWVKEKNCKSRAKTNFARKLELFCAKNLSEKQQIFEKWQNFENRPACKGYSLCKRVSLVKKLKMPKTCENPFEKNIRVVLRKNPLGITANIREMRRVSKSDILQRLQPMQRLQTLQKWSVWGKN